MSRLIAHFDKENKIFGLMQSANMKSIFSNVVLEALLLQKYGGNDIITLERALEMTNHYNLSHFEAKIVHLISYGFFNYKTFDDYRTIRNGTIRTKLQAILDMQSDEGTYRYFENYICSLENINCSFTENPDWQDCKGNISKYEINYQKWCEKCSGFKPCQSVLFERSVFHHTILSMQKMKAHINKNTLSEYALLYYIRTYALKLSIHSIMGFMSTFTKLMQQHITSIEPWPEIITMWNFWNYNNGHDFEKNLSDKEFSIDNLKLLTDCYRYGKNCNESKAFAKGLLNITKHWPEILPMFVQPKVSNIGIILQGRRGHIDFYVRVASVNTVV